MMKILASAAPAAIILLTLAAAPLPSRASSTTNSFACFSHDHCAAVGSICEGGRCSNPFATGCLHTMATRKGHADTNGIGTNFKPRVCNSDDRAKSEKEGGSIDANCENPDFPYKEVRISPGNWDSSIVLGLIYQILLSEVFRVPVTIEMGDGKSRQDGSFYDTESRYIYPDQVYPLEQLLEADLVGGDCSLSDKPCGHLLPEAAWDKAAQLSEQDKTRILPTEPNGVVGEFGFYIPAYTAKRNVDFLSFYGLSGDESRIKLANTFKEPTTWRDYCEGVDPSNCTNQDDKGISKRYPVTTEEKDSYFIPNLYTGHFRVTDRSNCTKNNNTCTGNVIGPSCDWSTYVDSQMYWNNISLTLNGGSNQVNNGYSYTQMTQVWRAANATKSNVFMWWWTPDILVDEFQGGDYSFQRVTLPTPTEECIKYRASELNAAKCSADIELRRGEAVGSCDYDAVIWQKVMSRGLKSSSLSEEDENALRSPAYEFLNKFALPAYSMSSIFQQWTKLMAENGTVYDTGFAARESICELVYNSYEEITRQFPKGFPRERETSTYSGLSFAGYVFGSIALALAIIAAICLNIWRDNKVIKIAQLNVLTAMIAGYIFAGLAAVLHAVAETSDAVCTLQQWTLLLCYCLEFVPIMAKISSINKLGRAARLFRKVQIDPNLFKKYLATSIGVVVAYLIIWTAVDMPRKIDDIKIIEEEAKTTVVAFYAGCASSSQVWGVVALVFESFVLLGASVLAYQSRDIIERMDEGCWLAFLVYSHAMFLIVRIAIKVLVATDTIMASMSTKIIAIVVALETIAAILVYFLPKFVRIKSKKAFKEIPVQLRGSTSNPMGYGRGQKKGKGGKRYITGITIPEGGIPNLIRKKPAEINGDSLKTAATSRRLSTESCSSNLPSTRRLSFTSRSSNLKTAKTSLSEDGALSSTSQDSRDAEIEKLMNELRKRNADVDLLTRKIYEHKRRGSLHSPFVSSVGDPVNKRRTSVVTFATSTSASPDFI